MLYKNNFYLKKVSFFYVQIKWLNWNVYENRWIAGHWTRRPYVQIETILADLCVCIPEFGAPKAWINVIGQLIACVWQLGSIFDIVPAFHRCWPFESTVAYRLLGIRYAQPGIEAIFSASLTFGTYFSKLFI